MLSLAPKRAQRAQVPKRVGSTTVRELFSQRELLWNLTLRELRSKYKRSALGWFWSMLNPISTIVIYSIVFSDLLHMKAPKGNPSQLTSFTLWLSCGLLPWNFFATCLGAGTGSIVGNAGLVKKVYFPREYLVISTVLSWLVSFFIEMAVLSLAFLGWGTVVFQWLPLVFLVGIVQAIYGLGIALALSVLNVFFRDIQHLIGIVLQAVFYLTPIVYQTSLIDGWGRTAKVFYYLNPMVHYAGIYRNMLFDGRLPALRTSLFIVGSALAWLVVGMAVFRRLEPRLVEEL